MLINGTAHDAKLKPQNSNGDTFAIQIQTKLNTKVANTFTVTFNTQLNNIKIAVNNGTTFQVLTNKDLKSRFGTTDAKSTDDILQNFDYSSPTYNQDNPFVSGFLDLLSIRNLYLSSPNLSSFSTYEANGEANIIKKVPVSSDFGYLIIESFTSTHDWLDCGGLTLNCIEFQLRDVKGNFVPLHDSNVSFSIVFSSVNLEDN
jgi:hypothetical protein